MKPRLIPVVMVGACLLLGVKLVDVWSVLQAQAATAEPQPQTPPKPDANADPAAPRGNPGVDPAQPAAAGADPLLMSPEEIDLLQKLSARRTELDKRAQDISQQEVLLKAAEQRIDDKISKLSTIESGISVKVTEKEQQDSEHIKSLVKIYETMKPSEAARIFASLDLTVSLDVLEHMKDRKVSAILASLDPDRAKQITMALAARHQQAPAPAPTATGETALAPAPAPATAEPPAKPPATP